MPHALETLRNIIDDQNVANLQCFIRENPNINYDNICPNGASALWWALMPPVGKTANKTIIGCLLNARKEDGSHLVNPVQTLSGITPNRYLLHNYHRSDSLDVRIIIEDAENLYEAPHSAAAPVRNLAAIAADGQSAHDSTIGPLSRGNVMRLHQHFVEEKSNLLDENHVETTGQEIEAHINALQKEQTENAEQIQYGLRFCYSNTSRFEFQPSEENKEAFSLTLAQLVALNWLAAKEQDAALLPVGATDKEALESRKKAILNILYDIATAYGKNGASCAGGACNRLGMALASQHKLVQAFPVGEKITAEVASLVFLRILGQKIEQLSKDNIEMYWSVIRYLTLPDNAEDIKNYENFISENKENILDQMREENIDEKWMAVYIAVVEEGDAYPLSNHKASYQLNQLMGIMHNNKLNLALFDGNTSIERAVDEAVDRLAEKLIKTSESFLFLKEKFGINRENTDLALEKNFILQWFELARRRQVSDDLHSFIKKLQSSEFSEDCFVLSFFQTEKEELKQKNPAQIKWLEHLSNEQIISLMSAVNEASPLGVANTDDLMQRLILKAMELGITANLSFDGMHFVGKDLRAFDFSGATLSNVTFENCLLPLAGSNIHCRNVSMLNCQMPCIDNNNSAEAFAKFFCNMCSDRGYISSSLVTQFYLTESSKESLEQVDFDAIALMGAARNCHVEVVKHFLASDKCSSKLLECSDDQGYTALMWAARNGHTEIVKQILASDKITRELLELADNAGFTALMWAVCRGGTAIVKEILASEKCSRVCLGRANSAGVTALICAASRGDIAIVKEILASDKCSQECLEPVDIVGDTALIAAATMGNTAIVKEILASDKCSRKCLESTDSRGNTALIWAVRHAAIRRHAATAKELLESNKCSRELLEHANVNGRTALIEAIARGNTSIVKKILEHDKCYRELLEHADVNGRTALIEAIARGATSIVKKILEHDKCSLKLLKQADRDGRTPSVWASRMGHPEIAKKIHTYISYQAIWESKVSEADKILAVLDDYCKGTGSVISRLSVFAHGHFNRHHTDTVRQLLKEYQPGDSLNDLLVKLRDLEKNETGSLARRLKFIESRIHLNEPQETQQEQPRPAALG